MPDQTARLKRDKKVSDQEKKRDNPGINSKLKPGDEERQLDKALMDSFPTSDPSSQSQPMKSGPAGDPRTKP